MKADCIRVTHPCATLKESKLSYPVRLACIRPAASVHPEPGSNSPLYRIICSDPIISQIESSPVKKTGINVSIPEIVFKKTSLSIYPLRYMLSSIKELLAFPITVPALSRCHLSDLLFRLFP